MVLKQDLRRVVVTGMGIVSCIGNSVDEVLESLKAGKSGISFSEDYAAKGFRSQVYGLPKINLSEVIDRRLFRFMGDAAAYVHLSMVQATSCCRIDTPDLAKIRSATLARGRLLGLVDHQHAIRLRQHVSRLRAVPRKLGRLWFRAVCLRPHRQPCAPITKSRESTILFLRRVRLRHTALAMRQK